MRSRAVLAVLLTTSFAAPALTLLGCDTLWSDFLRDRANPDLASGSSFSAEFSTSERPEVDILFVIDNSPGMKEEQSMLMSASQSFFDRLGDTATDYHVGVVSTDVGNQPNDTVFAAMPMPPIYPARLNCGSRIGDDGLLQAISCKARTLTSEAAVECQNVCGNSAPKDGLPYVTPDSAAGSAFRCIGFLGDSGCNVEGPLDAARRALDGRNAGFLRKRSLLSVIFLTDEDDCSVPVEMRSLNDPRSDDCPSRDQFCFNMDFRCFVRTVACNEALHTTGQKNACTERQPSDSLTSVDEVAQAIKALRPARRLFVAGIWPPKMADGKFKVWDPNAGAPPPSDHLNRFPSCEFSRSTGYPQVRLSRFLEQFEGRQEQSLCEPLNYEAGLLNIVKALQQRMPSCLERVPGQVAGQPSCVVGDVEDVAGHGAPAAPFPVCGASCCDALAHSTYGLTTEATVTAACAGETAAACYCAVPHSTNTAICPGGAIAGVVRKGPAPAGKVTSFACEAR